MATVAVVPTMVIGPMAQRTRMVRRGAVLALGELGQATLGEGAGRVDVRNERRDRQPCGGFAFGALVVGLPHR